MHAVEIDRQALAPVPRDVGQGAIREPPLVRGEVVQDTPIPATLGTHVDVEDAPPCHLRATAAGRLAGSDGRRSAFSLAIRISGRLDRRFPIDRLVRAPQEISQRLVWNDVVLRETTSKGEVRYESGDAGMGGQGGG